MIDKFRAQRIVQEGMRRELDEDEEMTMPDYKGEVICISPEKLASIMKVPFSSDRQSLETLGQAVKETNDGILLGQPITFPCEFMLRADKIDEIAQGPNPSLISKRQAIILLEVSNMAAGGDKPAQCFINGTKLAKAATNFTQLKTDKRFEIVGTGDKQIAVIDKAVLEGIAGMSWDEAKERRESRGIDIIRK